MTVYVVEVPENTISRNEVERIISDAFDGIDVKIQHKHSGSLKDLEWDELYSATMAAG